MNAGVLDVSRAEQRDDGHGNKIGSKQRQDHRKRQSRENKLAYSVEESDREENNNSRESSGQNRKRDFLPAFFCSHDWRFAKLQMAEDVFENDDRVVDQT